MLKKIVAPSLIGSVVLLAGACNEPKETFRMRAQGSNDAHTSLERYFGTMADNAMVSEFAISDFHFTRHTIDLSDTGAARLDRMLPYLSTYGGTVHYQTSQDDKKLIEGRLDHVRDYLAILGCDMKHVKVVAGLSTGTGMSAKDAITIKQMNSFTAQQEGGQDPAAGLTLPTGGGDQ